MTDSGQADPPADESEPEALDFGFSDTLGGGVRSTEEATDLGFSAEVLGRLARREGYSERYRLGEEIGVGGMGRVFEVWDEDLKRRLAMKIIRDLPGEAQRGDPIVARFVEEAQINGQLQHPGIVPVHELGLDETGRVFFTMKLIKGKTLSEVYAQGRQVAGRLTDTRALNTLIRVCETVAFAHSKGVLHRDLKPSNIMVGDFGETYVLDWGLAQILDGDIPEPRVQGGKDSDLIQSDRQLHAAATPGTALLTQDGMAVGTAMYSSPEQVRGERRRIGEASDIYSLGAILYEYLTGQQPFVAPGEDPSRPEVIERVKAGPPKRIETTNSSAPAELVAICGRAMQREPANRYATVKELADDLMAYQEGRVVQAHQTGFWPETQKWILRNRATASALGMLLLVLIVGLVTSLSLARSEKARADEVERLSIGQEYEDLITRASAMWPIRADSLPEIESWLMQARELVAELPRLRATRDQMGDPPASPKLEDRIQRRGKHEMFPILQSLRAEIAAKGQALAVRLGEAHAPIPTLDATAIPADSATLNALAWDMVGPERVVFGAEARGVAIAQQALALAPPDNQANPRNTLAWAWLAVGEDEKAIPLLESFVEFAAHEQRENAAEDARDLEDAILLSRSEAGREASRLEIAKLEEREAQLLSAIDAEQDSSVPVQGGSAQSRWWHTQLSLLINQLEGLLASPGGLLTEEGASAEFGWSMPRRLRYAKRLRDGFAMGGDFALRWERALPKIREDYPGLNLVPQEAIVPIGQDPASGLWEFWHVLSGEEPSRGSDGQLQATIHTGIVLVLLRGGTYWMGAQAKDEGSRHFDPSAATDESVHEVEISPFFLSKYELSQGQWKFMTGSNPSREGPDGIYNTTWNARGAPASLLQPVEQVSWRECSVQLSRIGLVLPTEAEWEYATRAGTDTPWWSGKAIKTLQGRGNFADKYFRELGGGSATATEELDDGYVGHAPVNTMAPNGFGLHHVHGNLWEWCRDAYERSFYLRCENRDPVNLVAKTGTRVVRGGCYSRHPDFARSSFRGDSPEDAKDSIIGVRPARPIDEQP